jgi:hypothetical protein
MSKKNLLKGSKHHLSLYVPSTFHHLTREQDNFHEASVKLAGQPGGELVGTGSFQKEKPS